MINKIQRLKDRLNIKKGEFNSLQRQISEETALLEINKESLQHHERALILAKDVAIKTQQQLEYQISELVTLAFAAVFEDPYELKVEFVQRRGKTECDIFFVRDGNKIEPMSASGGGALDIASFALRVASMRLMSANIRPLLILDEPFRFLSLDLQEKAALMLKEVSKKLGLQVIMVSHNETLIENADNHIKITNRNGFSEVA